MGRAHTRAGHLRKTDKLEAQGVTILQHLGSLPTVWIALGEIREARELPRIRMALSRTRTPLKNRVHSTLATPALAGGAGEYVLLLDAQGDFNAPKWCPQLIGPLPDETRRCVEQEVKLLDEVQEQSHRQEARLLERMQITPTIQLIQSDLAPAKILSIVIEPLVGSIDRLPSPHHLPATAALSHG